MNLSQRHLTGTMPIQFAEAEMIRKLKSGEYRLYSRKKNAKTGKRRNLGTFRTRKAAEAHERAVQYFKHH
jgi:DNA-binding transcriptional ArsR family regulator